MKPIRNLSLILVVLTLASTTCTKNGTDSRPEYREPLSFDIFKVYEDVPLDSEYVEKAHDSWDQELRKDCTVMSHTWLLGDYRVFVYTHCYWWEVGAGYWEMLFFTTSQPREVADTIHSTVTAYQVDFGTSGIELSKIGTYVCLDALDSIQDETEARSIMMGYLDQYLEEYSGVPYDSSLIQELKGRVQAGSYMRDWVDHYVCYEHPGDLGGAIIVNKLTSKLDFLGSSIFMGHGRRYFPPD